MDYGTPEYNQTYELRPRFFGRIPFSALALRARIKQTRATVAVLRRLARDGAKGMMQARLEAQSCFLQEIYRALREI